MAFLSDEYFNKFKDYIHQKSGIFFDNVNRSILESRLRERMRQKEIADAGEYYNLVLTNQKETETLLDSVTTNLTKFFRNEKQFSALREFVIPDIIERNKKSGNNTVKIWSAGCSTGEEPYSIAMDVLAQAPSGWTLNILSSDISLKSLMKAKTGYYPKERCEGIPKDFLAKYMEEEKEGYKVKAELIGSIRFDYHNLKHDNGERDFDIIFCRNVIIYFDKAEQERIVGHFYKCLKNPGYLFLGHSESLFGMQTLFKPEKIGESILYKKSEG